MSVLNSKQNYNWQNMVTFNTVKWIWEQDPKLLYTYLPWISYIYPKFYWTSTWVNTCLPLCCNGKQIAVKRNRRNGFIVLCEDSTLAAEDGKRLLFYICWLKKKKRQKTHLFLLSQKKIYPKTDLFHLSLLHRLGCIL